MWIKRGDEYALPVKLTAADELGAEDVRPADAQTVEFCLGHLRKLWPGEVTWDPDEGVFLVPVTQAETFRLGRRSELDVRVKLLDGTVVGLAETIPVPVAPALSREVL